MKRLLIGFFWFVGIFFGSCFILGFLVGLKGDSEGQSQEAVQEQAQETGRQLSNIIFLVSAGSAIYGTATQKLPGTKD